MRMRLGTVLTVGGAVVCVVGAIVVASGAYAHLPPALLKAAAYKLVLIASLALIAAGAVVRRAERRQAEGAERQAEPPRVTPGADPIAPDAGAARGRAPARQRDDR